MIRMPPFKEVFDRPPPSLTDYLVGTSMMPIVDELLTDQAMIMFTLGENLQWAQLQIRNQVNLGSSNIQFN